LEREADDNSRKEYRVVFHYRFIPDIWGITAYIIAYSIAYFIAYIIAYFIAYIIAYSIAYFIHYIIA
jgi:hypothetical protein